MFELEETVMGIIINAGQSRSLCYEALRQAKQGHFTEADDLLRQATAAANALLQMRGIGEDGHVDRLLDGMIRRGRLRIQQGE